MPDTVAPIHSRAKAGDFLERGQIDESSPLDLGVSGALICFQDIGVGQDDLVTSTPRATPSLVRRLGLVDAIVIGLGGMLGAGVFVVFGPAADAAGSALPIALVVAAIVAYCNATSSARLAARYPTSGGTYTYGRERLGPFWGIPGRLGIHRRQDRILRRDRADRRALPVAGQRPPGRCARRDRGRRNRQSPASRSPCGATRVIVLIVLIVLIGVFVWPARPRWRTASRASPGRGWVRSACSPVLRCCSSPSRAMPGSRRLGEEVRDPSRTIPRAIPIALLIVLVLYAMTAVVVEGVLGIATLSTSATPVVDAVAAPVGAHWFAPVVVIGAGIAAFGSLLSVMLGNSRTILAMARNSDLPPVLARVDSRTRTPVWAIATIGAITLVVVLVADVRDAIGFSAFTVLVYYAIANAAALTMPGRRTPARHPRSSA